MERKQIATILNAIAKEELASDVIFAEVFSFACFCICDNGNKL